MNTRKMNSLKTNSSTVKELLAYGRDYLRAKGIESFQNDSRILLMHISGLSKTELYTKDELCLAADLVFAYNNVLEARGKHRPLQYITGVCEFMSLDFRINESVLIPRPDTEILVETAARIINEQGYKSLLDICTGSGCIPVSLGVHTGIDCISAADLSESALSVAEENARSHGIALKLIHSDMFAAISGRFDIITSNPPYIPSADITGLKENVRDYEPKMALDGGADGLDFYRVIAKEAPRHLNAGGALLVEIGCAQAEDVSRIFSHGGFSDIKVIKDLAGLDRVAAAYMEVFHV